jgi:tetratricopeptide (TPR) repeat protein
LRKDGPPVNRRRIFTIGLFALTVILSSCATKKPVLYGPEGEPFTITKYEKIAQMEREAGRYENAVEVYRVIIERFEENRTSLVWAHYETGFCYFKLKKYDEAEVRFRRVINEFQDPAARKLAQDMLTRIAELKEDKVKKNKMKEKIDKKMEKQTKKKP